MKNNEQLNQTTHNQIRLTVLEKQAKKYREFLNSIKKRDLNNSTSKKINTDFFKSLSKSIENEMKEKNSKEKLSFISQKIKKLKDKNVEINKKVNDPVSNKFIKNELFEKLEKEIMEFEVLIDKLKEENQILKEELELLLEKDEKEKQKNSLEKDNKLLKEKIEKLKDKTQKTFNDSEKKPIKINKITYENNNEREH